MRVGVKEIMPIIGLGAKRIRQLAAEGKIPSAVQPTEGGKWFFDKNAVKQWMKRRELETWQYIEEETVKSIGSDSSSWARKSSGALAQQISAAQKRLKEESVIAY